jgi:hypothetical protein
MHIPQSVKAVFGFLNLFFERFDRFHIDMIPEFCYDASYSDSLIELSVLAESLKWNYGQSGCQWLRSYARRVSAGAPFIGWSFA